MCGAEPFQPRPPVIGLWWQMGLLVWFVRIFRGRLCDVYRLAKLPGSVAAYCCFFRAVLMFLFIEVVVHQTRWLPASVSKISSIGDVSMDCGCALSSLPHVGTKRGSGNLSTAASGRLAVWLFLDLRASLVCS